MKTVEQLRGLYNEAVDELEKRFAEIDALGDDADEDAVTACRTAFAAAVELADARKADLEEAAKLEQARSVHQKIAAGTDETAPITVGEPDMYVKGGRSFFGDLYRSQLRGDPIAADRIMRHQLHELAKMPETRAVSTGGLGGIIPPQYLVDLYAKAQRFGRVYADQCRGEDLPDEGMSLIIPRLTQGTTAGIQASESATVATQDPTEADLTVPVRTVAGYSPVSRQTLERASYSEAILFEDLIARYFQTLDSQVLNGSGSSGQHLGVLNTSGVSTATISSWSTANAWAAIAGETGILAQINQWAATVGAAADKLFMHPRRWGAFLGLLDSAGRPLFGIDGNPNYAPLGDGEASGYGRVGQIAGLPVYTDANIPTNLGAGTNQDVIVAHATPAVLLWERRDDPVTLAFEQQAGTSLQVQLIVYGYSAYTAGRYPAASGVVSGAGLT